MRRPAGNPGGCTDPLDAAAGSRRLKRCGRIGDDWAGGWQQRLNRFAQALFDRGQQHWQGIRGDRRFSGQLQFLTAAGAEAEQFAQALDRHRRLRAVEHTHTDIAFEALGQLRQHLRRASVQPMRVGQHDPHTGPVSRSLAAQHLQYGAAAGGLVEGLPTAFDQHFAQALKQRLMGRAEAGQAEQAIERLVAITQGLLRGDEGKARLTHLALAVQPPQALTQWQGVGLLQHGSEAAVDTTGALQQTRTAPGQLVEIFGRQVQADQLRIQRQFLRRTLQQFEQRLGRAGPAQRLGQVGFTEGTGQQLQQAQMFVGTGGNADGQVDDLAIPPVHTFRELQQAHAGGEHQLARLRGAMRDGDALAKKRRALRFARLQAVEITVGNQAVGNQLLRQQAQRR